MVVFKATSAKVFGLKDNKSFLPYLLLIPGLLWLALFFIVPIFSLGQMSTKVPGAQTGQFVQGYRFANYVDAFNASTEQFLRSFLYGILATIIALAIAYPLALSLIHI